MPKDIGIDTPDNSWSSVKDVDLISRQKAAWSEKFLTNLIFGSTSDNQTGVTPATITDKLIQHVLAVTKPSRDFMEQNPNLKLPANYKMYPGKMVIIAFTFFC